MGVVMVVSSIIYLKPQQIEQNNSAIILKLFIMSLAFFKQMTLICLMLPYGLQLAARNEQNNHLLSAAKPNNHEYLAQQLFSDFTVIGIIVVFLAVGACCFYFRGCFEGGSSSITTVIVPAASQRNQVAPRRYQPEEYQEAQPRNQPKNNTIIEYFNAQKATTTLASQPIKQTTTPYMNKKAEMCPWQSTSATITSCAVCNLFNKSNEIPIVQVQCLEDHCFHIGCISHHRSKMTLSFSGNGINKCPKCKQTYSPIVKILCPTCKGNTISVNLPEFSDSATGEISTQRIVQRYGGTCHNCR